MDGLWSRSASLKPDVKIGRIAPEGADHLLHRLFRMAEADAAGEEGVAIEQRRSNDAHAGHQFEPLQREAVDVLQRLKWHDLVASYGGLTSPKPPQDGFEAEIRRNGNLQNASRPQAGREVGDKRGRVGDVLEDLLGVDEVKGRIEIGD